MTETAIVVMIIVTAVAAYGTGFVVGNYMKDARVRDAIMEAQVEWLKRHDLDETRYLRLVAENRPLELQARDGAGEKGKVA